MLVLASASPRRAELLRAAGLTFDVLVADVDETVHPGEASYAYVKRVAEAKALAVRDRAGARPVLAADTVVVVDQAILGKPADAEDARRMLRILSGRAHQVLTAVCLAMPARAGEPGVEMTTAVASTTVEFATLTDAEIGWYVASNEPFDKAGAYAIQGLGSRFVSRIEGSYSNVVGLPVAVVYDLCKRSGMLIS